MSKCFHYSLYRGHETFDANGHRRVVDVRICTDCHEWLSLGQSNDAPIEVAVEIRAAELSDLAGSHSTTTEAYGWLGYSRDADPIYFGGVTDHWESGWLGRAIHDHDAVVDTEAA